MKSWQVSRYGEPEDVLELADVPDGLRRLAAGDTAGRLVFQP